MSEFIEAQKTPSSIRDCRGADEAVGDEEIPKQVFVSNCKTGGKIFLKAATFYSYQFTMYIVLDNLSTSIRVISALF